MALKLRTSSRRSKLIPQLSLGKVGCGYNSGKDATPAQFRAFVQEFTFGPHVVSVPVPPQRHAFLVDIQHDAIYVSDWGGKDNKDRDTDFPEWHQYCQLLRDLQLKFGLPVIYYDIDPLLEIEADIQNNDCEGGGCAFYIYKWLQKYYPHYSI
jgi:hypothetical protein